MNERHYKSCKILIWGVGFRNKGAEAMMRTVQCELIRRLGRVTFYAHVPVGQSSLAYTSGILPVVSGNGGLMRLAGVSVAEQLAVRGYLARKHDWKRSVRSLWDYPRVRNYVNPRLVDHLVGGFDAVVDVHGFAYGDDWGVEAVRAAREWCRYCREMGKPFCFMPQSWGSFHKEGFAEPLRDMLAEATQFYARDSVSRQYLAGVLDKSVDAIQLSADVALRFDGASLSAGAALLENYGVRSLSGRPIIGVAPNLKIYERTEGQGGANLYVRTLVHLCDSLAARLSAQVILIPNSRAPDGEDRMDDRYLCGLIHASIMDRRTCIHLRDYHSAEEVKALVGNCDILIGSRYHALVFALSQGVPCLALGWSHKYRELMNQFSMADYTCGCDSMDELALMELTERLWSEREVCRERILKAMTPLLNEVDFLFDNVARHVKGALV